MPEFGAVAPLGLSDAQRAAYELLMAHPSASAAELAAGWNRDESLDLALAALEERSLAILIPGPPDRYRAVAPGVAFDALLADFEERLEHARRHVGTLDAAFQARPTSRDTTTVIEVVTGRRAVRQRLLQIRRGARQQVGVLVKPPHLPGADGEPLRRGVTVRTIYDRSSIELSTVEDALQGGQLARMLPDLPVSLYLADDRVAVLPLQRQPAATDAVVLVRPSALLDALVKLFESLWQRALPLHAPPASSGAEAQRLITLLLSGLTDEAIAHQLGLSHRTVQRRVAALMADLGAHTRFQAGVQAALNRMRQPQ